MSRMMQPMMEATYGEPETVVQLLPGSSVTLDEAWSPYVQGTLVMQSLPSKLTQSGSLAEFRLRLRTRVGTVMNHLADLSATFAGQTLAQVSAAWQGQTLAQLSATPGRNWNSDAALDPTGLELYVYGQEAEQNDDGTWSIRVESAEARLAEKIMPADMTLTAATISALVPQIANQAVGEPGPTTPAVHKDGPVPAGLDSTNPDAPVVPYQAGDAPWETINSLLTFANLRLMPDSIVDADWQAHGTVPISATLNLISATERQDRSTWARRILVLFDRARTLGNRPAYIYDGLAPDEFDTPSTKKTLPVQLSIGSPFPAGTTVAPDYVRPIRQRIISRAQTMQLEAAADFRATPRRPLAITLASGDTYSARVQSVTFNLDDCTMSITCMDVTET